uniref:Reverse transcriptase domain-containing protein n=1 Tax=Tanacetum cinerariifolium TaxID=118510 RepID=A0A699GXZ9_TANCI|nr:reverse transcriptase domain-containing protein [Tanacetum cinerariifolium]
MSTRSSARNLFPPLDNPELTIRRRSRVDPTLLNDFEMATDGNGDPLVPDLRTMEEFIKVNGVTDDALRLYLFPHSLTHHATAWFNHLPRNSITTFEQMAKMFLAKYFPPSMVTKHGNEITNFCQRPDESLFEAWAHYKLSIDRCPNHNMLPVTQIDTFYNGLTLIHLDTINAAAGETFMERHPEECYDLIENMTAHHNDWDTCVQRNESSSFITFSSDPEIVALKAEMVEINKNLMKVLQINQQVKAVARNYKTYGGPHSYNDYPVTVGQTQNVYAVGSYNQGGNSYQPQGNRNLLSYRSKNYLGPPGFNQNQNRNNQNQNYQNQNRNQGNINGIPQGNNQERNQFFQGASHSQNPPPPYQAPAYQAPGYQAPVHQASIPQSHVVTTTEFTNYMKENDVILKHMQTNTTSLTNSNLELKNMFGQFMKMNTASSSSLGTLLSNTITNPKEDLKGITTRSGNGYKGPTIPTTSSSLPKVVERETEVTKDTLPPTNNESTKDVQSLVVQVETPIPNSEPVVAPVAEPVIAPVSASKPNQKLSIPYPSRLHDQKLCDKANDQKEKFFKIFQDLNFNVSFADALILMQKFGPTIKSLLTNKEKLFELARTPLYEHCSAVLLKKLPEKLGDPGKFLIPCDFPRMDECLALADLGVSINLMPLSIWNKLSLPKLSATCMTLELTDRSISHPVGVAEDVFVKVGTFHFSADFVVVDFDADPRIPLILGRSFLKIMRALIDVYEGELTLRVGKEAVTFNLDQTTRYSANYDAMSVNRIDLIDLACEEYSQEVLGFSMSGNPTPSTKPIISNSSPTLTPFGDSDFLLEGDIILLKEFLNNDPSSPPLLPQELKVVEPTKEKSSIDEPPVVELKDLPPHLEYTFLEGDDKLPVIIAKDLKDEEKTALIKVLKSHKQALAWQLFDIKGINLEFYTHKILMEDDFKPSVQHQRRVNPKIHEVNKMEVLKLLDARLIYPISDSPWEKTHFMVKEGIVLVHKISKNGIEVDKAKVDVIAKLPHPTTIKGAENLAAFYLSRLENPHQSVLEKKEINETFPLETLNMVSFRGDSSTPWFADFANYHAGNFVVKGMSSQQKNKFFKDVRHYAGTTLSCLKFVRIKSTDGVFTARKPLIFSRLTTMDPLGDTTSRTTPPKRCLTLVFILPQSIVMPTTWSNLVTLDNVRERFRNVMLKYGVTHRLATAYHPQTSGQVEVSNRGLKRILKRNIGENRASWSDKLDDALWAFRTAFKTPIECTPYNLLNELNELRDQAYENSLIYKEKTKRIYDSKIKDRVFNVGDRVLLFNSRLRIFSGKIKTRWSGPFTIIHVFPYGIVELSQTDEPNFKEFLNFEDSCSGFCPSITGSSLPQLHFGNQISKSYRITVHSTFHVSNLKKCLSDEPLTISLDEVHIDDKLRFVEEPVEIMDREVKRLKQSRIPIIKVRWNSRRGPEFTWEREDQFRKKIAPDLEASRARGFVLRPLELQSLAYGNLIS